MEPQMPAARTTPYRFSRSAPIRPARTRKSVQTAPKAAPRALRAAPPSGELINAVIQYADRIKDMGGNRSMLRLSPRRLADPVICEPLGREAARLGDIAVIWDDEEDQIVRVLDAQAGDAVAPISTMEPLGAEVELTTTGLAYLAASQGRLH
jgi:hypothetical protein